MPKMIVTRQRHISTHASGEPYESAELFGICTCLGQLDAQIGGECPLCHRLVWDGRECVIDEHGTGRIA